MDNYQLFTINYQLFGDRSLYLGLGERSRASMDNGQLTMDNYQLFTINY